MKKITEPLSETVLHVHYGKEGIETFKKYLDTNEVEYGEIEGHAGFQIDNHIFIHDIKDLHTVTHEFIHFMDYIVERLNIATEREFKAYVGAYMLNKLIKLSIQG